MRIFFFLNIVQKIDVSSNTKYRFNINNNLLCCLSFGSNCKIKIKFVINDGQKFIIFHFDDYILENEFTR